MAQARGHANPSHRLGGSAFNHQQSSGSEEEYDRLRNLARQEHSRMADCFDKVRMLKRTAGSDRFVSSIQSH